MQGKVAFFAEGDAIVHVVTKFRKISEPFQVVSMKIFPHTPALLALKAISSEDGDAPLFVWFAAAKQFVASRDSTIPLPVAFSFVRRRTIPQFLYQLALPVCVKRISRKASSDRSRLAFSGTKFHIFFAFVLLETSRAFRAYQKHFCKWFSCPSSVVTADESARSFFGIELLKLCSAPALTFDHVLNIAKPRRQGLVPVTT